MLALPNLLFVLRQSALKRENFSAVCNEAWMGEGELPTPNFNPAGSFRKCFIPKLQLLNDKVRYNFFVPDFKLRNLEQKGF